MPSLRVSEFMTQHPVWVAPEAPLAAIHSLMWERRIRHVPVLQDGRVVGMLSLRDMHLVESFDPTALEQATVGEAMREPLVVSPDTPVLELVEQLLSHRGGSAAVLERGALVGIFTRTDALKAFSRLLRQADSVAAASAPWG